MEANQQKDSENIFLHNIENVENAQMHIENTLSTSFGSVVSNNLWRGMGKTKAIIRRLINGQCDYVFIPKSLKKEYETGINLAAGHRHPSIRELHKKVIVLNYDVIDEFFLRGRDGGIVLVDNITLDLFHTLKQQTRFIIRGFVNTNPNKFINITIPKGVAMKNGGDAESIYQNYIVEHIGNNNVLKVTFPEGATSSFIQKMTENLVHEYGVEGVCNLLTIDGGKDFVKDFWRGVYLAEVKYD